MTVTTPTLISYSPATGEPVGEVPITAPAKIPAIVAGAREAQKAWGAITGHQRADILRPAGQAILDNKDELARLLSAEQGKPLADGLSEVTHTGEKLMEEVDEIAEAVAPRELTGEGMVTTLRYDPLGVVAAITPWNFPMLMPQWMALPALVAGNAVVLKPSEQTPLIAQAYADILNRFLPPHVLQVVHGADDQGRALVASDVNLIAFTGSKATGQKIMAAAAEGLKRVILELGSKDPLIVLEGADLDAAAEFAARNSFRNCGQVCVSTERIYVQGTIAEAFTEKLAQAAKAYRSGDPFAEGSVLGPMVMREQKEHVARQIEDAVAQGAKLVLGGGDHPGNAMPATILRGVTHEMDIMKTETFGPVAPIMTFEHPDEAVSLANDSEYGLGAVVFGPEPLARDVAARIDAGMIGVNRGIHGAKGSPWVGARHSGIGYHMGPDGHRQFCQVRTITRNA
ncbi:MAG: aldehyde dehydrogenase [Phycisphaeraceae bacterium]|nr:MAG: aldehyde dehydrogenase [Phycisphaeraceae bacterium]